MLSKRACLGVCLFILSLASTGAWAQGRRSAIVGSVVDQQGGAVRGVRITAIHVATGEARVTSTNDDGAYRFPLLEVGAYRIVAATDGFKTATREGIVLELDREAVVDMSLAVGDIATTIQVEGPARLVEATPSALTSLVDSRTIESLPLNGRDYIQLAALQAGAPIARARAKNANFGYGINISISGSRPYENNFRLDGVSLNSYHGSTPGSINGVNLGLDAIQEFSVQSSTYSAQYGRAAGGIVNAVTKSGGNDFHGNASYFHRNDNLDAANFFDVGRPPKFRRHQFAGSLGGPVVREKLFFFASYEGLRETRGNTTINTTLTAEARRGQLKAGPVSVDPIMAKVANLYPLPSGEILGDTGLFVFANDEVAHQNFFTTRLDYNIKDSDKLFLRYNIDDGARSSETDFALGRKSNSSRVHSAALEETHIFSPNLLNVARLGWLRTSNAEGRTTTQVAGTDDPGLAFVPGSSVIGPVLVTGLTDLPGGSGAFPSDINGFSSWQLSNDWTWLRGRHSVKFGGAFEGTAFRADSQTRTFGDFRFRGIAQFLTNVPDRFRAQLPGSDTTREYRQSIGALYAQDVWQAAKRLTVDFGIRWEWATVPTEIEGKLANLDALTDTQVRTGDPLFKNPSWTNLHPRLGLAWDARGDHKTLVRAGYGIFPDLILSNSLIFSGVRNPPFFLRGETRRLSRGDFPSAGYTRLLSDPNPEYRVERFPSNPDQPYVQQWNLAVEQTLSPATSLRVAYVGSRGVHLSSLVADANLVTPVVQPDGRLFFPANGQRANSVFGRIRNHTFDAESFYYGLQTRLQFHMGQTLQAQVSYSYSKSIDDSSNFASDAEAANGAMLPLNGSSSFNRGLSGHDVRHYFVAAFTWALPLEEGAGWRRFLGGWQLSGVMTYASGNPTSVWLEYDAAGTKTSESGVAIGQRPDLVPGASNNPVTGDPRGWVRADAFRRPAAGYLGNLGRNTIIGPDYANVDLALVKRVTLSGSGKVGLDLRFEAFNLFNRTNFDLPSAERMALFSSATAVREDFGRITSANKSREIQLGLKLRF